ncbi:DUF4350 domain-containing protein [Streptomyces sp. TLI_171]|uniref:DUF4350 domain-containing protein n=1 Tax=Streptomyces sp. TLI_171 TaxID=1938859 RepID=UPI000C388D8D|nr:DUF4350 domain-containing protein [Streptomyces sp. TLI_171]RKE19331.1 hypothetical protein BX266_2650 [Streptomyces sp. TLI_171]
MTAIAPPPATAEADEQPDTPPPAGPTGPTVRALWLRWRWWVLSCLVLLVTGALVVGIPGKSHYPPYDPRSGDATGTRAADQLLQQHRVDSRTAATRAELTAALRAADTTVVLAHPNELPVRELAELGSIGRGENTRLVLIAPNQPALNAFAPGILATGGTADPGHAPAPACDLPEAVHAGPADLAGQSYHGRPGDVACYPVGSRPGLVSRTTGTQQVIVLGAADPLTNARLDQEGNAALALGLLGAHPALVWQTPDLNPTVDDQPATGGSHGSTGGTGSGSTGGSTSGGTGGSTTGGTGSDGGTTGGSDGGTGTYEDDDGTGQGKPRSFADAVPAPWHWAFWQLVLAVLLTVAWRARRLGPVLSERLPAVVRASETTEGRARLYHRANARGHAAETLRRATRRRAATALGLPHTSGDPDPAALTEAAAARIGRPAADLQQLLYGPAPTDDAALLRLADDLDDMEWQVRQP